MTPGSLSIEKRAAPWSKEQADGYTAMVAVGVLAGVVVAFARMPLQLPGHKALWWMTPVLVARVLTRRRLGATVGAIATVATTLSLDGRLAGGSQAGHWVTAAGLPLIGRLAGGIYAAPLVAAAGGVLDLAAGFVERHTLGGWRALLWLGAAGCSANLVCFVKRLFEPAGASWSGDNLHDLIRAAVSHGVFGLIAGLTAAMVCYGLIWCRSTGPEASSC